MFKVSPLRLRVFRTCRLRYKYQYVEKRQARLRIADTAGSCVHNVLCEFFKLTPAERTAGRLLSDFDTRWEALSPRYLAMPGVTELGEAARTQLQRFAESQDLIRDPFLIEAYFETHIAPDIVLFGRMDRVDEEDDRSLHVIDYKTSAAPDEVDADQLRLYALIVQDNLERTVSKASFWYLDDSQVWTTELEPHDNVRVREEALALSLEMQRVDEFPATIGPHCAHCPYLSLCERREEIAQRRHAEGW
ncbi:MAG TPA: PD-(D/E)XK nuclease family protein [Dehalococcoidia bacterium]|nr:PD-(D/E)XK nuclease family protein [Dehalococcoidia bacterium]